MNKMKNFKTFFSPNKVTSFILYFSILAFIIAFNFSDHGGSGWQLQTLPFLNDRPLRDMTFTDSLTGYGITKGGNVDSDYVIKTSNGGENWLIINTLYAELNHVNFINSNTGFICGGDRLGHSLLLKTSNGGNNWNQINTPELLQIIDMSVISEDSLWITGSFFSSNLYNSSNGGISWDLKFTTGNGIDKIYFFDKNLGFFGNNFELMRTTNYGNNWSAIPSQDGFTDMFFIDNLTGWKCKDSTSKTTDGGITWERQFIPTGGIILGNLTQFSKINKDTIWGSGGTLEFSVNRYRGILYYTSNGGNNWLYQIPDTSFGIPGFKFINFIGPTIGWANESFFSFKTNGLVNIGIHTLTGGDSTFLTNIMIENSNLPINLRLFQNYPNPFNPKTKILYELYIRSKVLLKIYNSLGIEIKTLVDQNQNIGEYNVDFDGSGYSSGVYFYSLFIDNVRMDTKKMLLIR